MLQYVSSEGTIKHVTNAATKTGLPSYLKELRRVAELPSIMRATDLRPRINSRMASEAIEKEALLAIREKRYDKACNMLVWGIRHDLALTSIKPPAETSQLQAVPATRRYCCAIWADGFFVEGAQPDW